MTTARANCREKLTAADLEFVAAALSPQSPAAMVELLTDPAALEAALESDRLLKSILESPATVAITPQLYFYVLTRHMLRTFDRDVADYIAGILTTFVKMERVPPPYLTDMLIALQHASTEREFQIRVQVGNYSLFLSGVFPQYIQERARHRGAPAIGFYDEVGSTNYRLAAEHRLARTDGLADVYRTMADHFTEVRSGLNHLTDRLLCLEPQP